MLQIRINSRSGFAPFGNRPDNERLAATHVACAEDARDRRHVVFISRDIAAWIKNDTKLIEHSFANWSEETHGEKHEVGLHRKFAS